MFQGFNQSTIDYFLAIGQSNSRGEPVKEYFYLRFRLNGADRKNIPGFYLDASLTNFRYGLNIYHRNADGMERIRLGLLADKKQAQKLIRTFYENNDMEISGEKYKTAHYPQESPLLREWLERRQLSFFHEEQMNPTFFDRKLLENMTASFRNMKEVYLFLKSVLI